MSDVGVSGGPSGIRTQDRRIKSQWLQPQNSLKKPGNCRETAQNSRKAAGFRPPPRYKMATMATPKKGGNAGLRPKEHTCANIATVRALTDEDLPTAHGGTGVSRV